MAHPYNHSESSARKYGGNPDDYLSIHQWFDESKRSFSDNRHRALRHHAEGIFLCAQIFGVTLTNSVGKKFLFVRLVSSMCKKILDGFLQLQIG